MIIDDWLVIVKHQLGGMRARPAGPSIQGGRSTMNRASIGSIDSVPVESTTKFGEERGLGALADLPNGLSFTKAPDRARLLRILQRSFSAAGSDDREGLFPPVSYVETDDRCSLDSRQTHVHQTIEDAAPYGMRR